MAVNTMVIEVPMLNAAPPLRVSVMVSSPPGRRIGGGAGLPPDTEGLSRASGGRAAASDSGWAWTSLGSASVQGSSPGRTGKSVVLMDMCGPVRGWSPDDNSRCYARQTQRGPRLCRVGCVNYAVPVRGFEPLPAQVDLPALEHEILARWRDAGIFERSLKQTAGGPAWIFYEGPPTAHGLPGAHPVEARTFKDLFPRFKTIAGHHVPRQAGGGFQGP